ncbi:hypothetical protein WJX72_007472 [[Myrmecia] bisecta]|uniref:Exostosin GT47 domain-containing protein n=1 Tax=[Myrmecia] bisecta TaxID=41462 RepID=A0AAW1Q4A7_9CHLO
MHKTLPVLLLGLLCQLATAFPDSAGRRLSSLADKGSSAGQSVYLSHSTLRVLIWEELPQKYQAASAAELYGFATVGEPFSTEDSLWRSHWADLDKHIISQLHNSPLRVHSAELADVVFVPAVLDINKREAAEELLAQAERLFPLLKQKPHVIALNHPLTAYHHKWHGWLDLPIAKAFTFLVPEGWVYGWDHRFDNYVGMPFLSQVRWSRGRVHNAFDAQYYNRTKTLLATASFTTDKHEIRPRLQKHCTAAPDLCAFVEPAADERQTAIRAFDGMKRAWHTMHAKDDYITNAGVFESLTATSLAVAFEADFSRLLPFQDMIDWSKLVCYLPTQYAMPGDANLLQTLQEKCDRNRYEKIEYLHGVRHVFQWSLNPRHELISFSTKRTIHPEDDALTVTFKMLLKNLCARGLLSEKRCQ